MKRYPVVILPGWMLGSTRFSPLTTELKKHGYTSHVVDFPGFAQGEKIFRPWTLSDYVAFLKEFLKEHKIDKAIFICHSFGGRVALKLLSEEPKLAHALILTGTPGYRSVNSNRLWAIATVAKIGRALMALPLLSVFEDVARRVFSIVVGARDISQLRGFMKQTFINIVEEKLEGYMKEIRVPTLLVWGAQDGLVAVSIAEKMQQTIKKSELVVIPGMYHNVVYKDPVRFAEYSLAFLKSLEK